MIVSNTSVTTFINVLKLSQSLENLLAFVAFTHLNYKKYWERSMRKQLPILEKNQRGSAWLVNQLTFCLQAFILSILCENTSLSLNLDSSHFSSERRIGMSPVDGSLQSRSWKGAEKGTEQPYHTSHMSFAWVKEENRNINHRNCGVIFFFVLEKLANKNPVSKSQAS